MSDGACYQLLNKHAEERNAWKLTQEMKVIDLLQTIIRTPDRDTVMDTRLLRNDQLVKNSNISKHGLPH